MAVYTQRHVSADLPFGLCNGTTELSLSRHHPVPTTRHSVSRVQRLEMRALRAILPLAHHSRRTAADRGSAPHCSRRAAAGRGARQLGPSTPARADTELQAAAIAV